jgi:hypothetical protein
MQPSVTVAPTAYARARSICEHIHDRYGTFAYEPVISFRRPKNARFRAELIPQLTGTLW